MQADFFKKRNSTPELQGSFKLHCAAIAVGGAAFIGEEFWPKVHLSPLLRGVADDVEGTIFPNSRSHVKPRGQFRSYLVFVKHVKVSLMHIESVDGVYGLIAVAGTSHPRVLAPSVCSQSCGNGATAGAQCKAPLMNRLLTT